MMDSSRMFVFLFSVVLVALASADPVCIKQSLCSCETSKGTIDLSLLPKKVLTCNDPNGMAQFKYSPCTENGTQPCMNAMLCMSTISDHESIGVSSGESFVEKDGKLAIEYNGEDNKTSTVILKCDEGVDGDLSMVKNAVDDDSYVFELTTRLACLGVTKTSPKSPQTTKTSPKSPQTTKTSPKSPKTTKTSPKSPQTTKTSPKSPQTTKTSPKSPKTTKTSPKSPQTTKTSPKSPQTTKTTPKSSKTTKTSPKSPQTTKTTPKATNTTPKHSSTTHHGAASSIQSSFKMTALAVMMLVFRQFF